MVPCRTHVRLASNQAVYAEGRGSVLFRPIIGGKPAQNVLFCDLLYVPALNDNLLAIIPMSRQHGVKVAFEPKGINFVQEKEKFMTASYQGNVGYLDGDGREIPLADVAIIPAGPSSSA